MKGLAWTIVIAATWLLVAPWVLHYKGLAQANDIILGLVIGITALIIALGKDQP